MAERDRADKQPLATSQHRSGTAGAPLQPPPFLTGRGGRVMASRAAYAGGKAGILGLHLVLSAPPFLTVEIRLQASISYLEPQTLGLVCLYLS